MMQHNFKPDIRYAYISVNANVDQVKEIVEKYKQQGFDLAGSLPGSDNVRILIFQKFVVPPMPEEFLNG